MLGSCHLSEYTDRGIFSHHQYTQSCQAVSDLISPPIMLHFRLSSLSRGTIDEYTPTGYHGNMTATDADLTREPMRLVQQ